MAKIRLADLRAVLKPGEKKRISEVNGLTLIITGTEKGTQYKFQHRCTFQGKRREKILKVTELADARKIALERMEQVEKGIDPDIAPEKGLTVADAVEEYQKVLFSKDLSQCTVSYRKRQSNLISEAFGDREFKSLTEKEIHSFIMSQQETRGTLSAKQCLQTFTLFLRTIHIMYGIDVPNLAGMQSLFKAPSVVHRAALTEGDLSENILQIFLSFDSQRHRDFLLLAFMLLMRKEEFLSIKIDDIDFQERVLYIRKTKTLKTGFRIPITDILEVVLRYLMQKSSNEYLLSGNLPHSHYRTVRINLKLKEMNLGTIHGIRSIGRMWMHQNKIPFEVAESCLTHVVGSQVTRAYLRTDYFEERKEAMEKWHQFLYNTLQGITPCFS